MKLQDFIDVYMFAAVSEHSAARTLDSMCEAYDGTFILLPRIVCKDGFSISIQAHRGSMAASENGVRRYGVRFLTAEWGFPSAKIKGEKYNADLPTVDGDMDTRKTIGAYVNIEILDALLTGHGGIDVNKTLTNHLS